MEGRQKLDISASSVVRTILILVGFWMLWELRSIALIVLTAIVIASAIEPLTSWFRRHGVHRLLAVVIIYLTTAIILFGFIYFFIPSLISDIAQIIAKLPDYIESLEAAENANESVLGSALPQGISLAELLRRLQTVVSTLSESALSFISAIFGGVLSFILIVVLSFYFAVQENGIANFLRLVTPYRYESYVVDLWKRSQGKIGYWLQGQLILSLIVAVLSYAGLLILGVDNALVLAILAGIFELIPIFGPILASIPAIAIGFLDGGVQLGLLVVALYVIIQQFENHLLYPLVVKKVVGVPAIVVILSLLIGAELGGFLGVLLSVPLAAVVMELANDLEAYKREQNNREQVTS